MFSMLELKMTVADWLHQSIVGALEVVGPFREGISAANCRILQHRNLSPERPSEEDGRIKETLLKTSKFPILHIQSENQIGIENNLALH